MTKLSAIEGIGETYTGKLESAGVTSIENLLETCCERKGHSDLAAKTGISDKLILKWANRADLSRIRGISTQYADLLEFAGVDTIPALAQRVPDNLHAKIVEVNEDKKLVRKVPALSQVQDWIDQAKELPRMMNY